MDQDSFLATKVVGVVTFLLTFDGREMMVWQATILGELFVG